MTKIIKRPGRYTLLTGSMTSAFILVALTSAAAAQAHAGTAELKIEDFVGVIEIQEGPGLSYTLDMNEDLVSEPVITLKGEQLLVEGGLRNGPERCRNNDKKFLMKMKSGQERPLASFPSLIIEVPAGTDVEIGQLGGRLSLGDTKNLSLTFQGCGDAVIGNVSDALKLAILGSGDVTAGSVGKADVSVRGSGDVEMGNVAGSADIAISGSGDVKIGEISGVTSLAIKGSGDTEIDYVRDNISIDLQGSGDVDVLDGGADQVSVRLMGSGDITYNGSANDVSVLLKGSGDVYVARSTGNRVVNRHGSGDVRIGSWKAGDDD